MNDDEMDELLIEGARDYNAPGGVPRDEMWTRIREARGKRDAGSGKRETTRRSAWIWMSGAVAAALILAVGIAIGRRIDRPATPVLVAETPAGAPTQTPAAVTKEDTIIPRLREETRNTGRRVQSLAVVNGSDDNDGQPNLAYRLVLLRHMVGTEAMITSFRAAARRGDMDSQMVAWSRELLSTTRMLEASPVTKDPTMKRLLEDLDLVLVQIAQYATRGVVNAEELDLIEESINKRNVITQLRSSPVRNIPAGT